MVAPSTDARVSPIRMALVNVRFPLAPSVMSGRALEPVASALADRLPIARPASPPGLSITVGGAAPGAGGRQPAFRLLARNSFTSATISPSTCLIETTHYGGWTELRSLLEITLRALDASKALAGIEGMTVRFINEIRTPSDSDSFDALDGLVNPQALAGHSLATNSLQRSMTEGVTITSLSANDGSVLVVRHGPRRGFVVDERPLKLPTPLRRGPFYLIDIENSRSLAEADAIPPFTLESTLQLADDLHAPVQRLFEAIVSPTVREESRNLEGA